ncbi:tetratricopeptide repeat protein [Treponema endosymbiont of Eucomonympha sp.]|uniref:tetratricopeptide repeat protein n=1 Tax=Treponema endosymbiont of Eucomonympha sp. TaxID=1580831 RepID=UPI000A70A0D2|nr:tetratricopeptide repeat protein [Treponema endosymbiont of Eucomonympha sp.]
MAETDEKINAEAAAFWERGNARYAQKEYGAAIEAYTKATELQPDFAEAFHNRGNAYWNKGDYDKAIADYTEAVRLKPNDASAFLNRGIAYSDTGDHGRAIADYNEAIRLQPDYAKAFNNRGGAYEKKDEHDKAIADFGEAIRLKPKNAKAFNNRGVAYGNKGDYGKAIADYTEAIRLQPDLAEAFCARGNTYTSKGDYDKAIADYDEAIRLQPDYALAFFGRGFAYSSKGNHDKAIADCDETVRLKPDYALAFFGRGFAYRNKGDDKNCFLDFKEAANLNSRYIPWFTEFVDEKIKGGIDWFLTAFTYEELGTALHPFLRIIAFCKKKGADSEAHKELAQALHSLWKDCFVDESNASSGKYLYQYASMSAFEKMFESRALRLAPTAYQNDSEEGKVFFAEIEGILTASGAPPLLLDAIKKIKNHNTEESLTYIRSFSENADEIVMWNSSYGHSGEGVAVGIDWEKLKGGFGAGDVFRKLQDDEKKADKGNGEPQNLKLDQTGLYKVQYVKKDSDEKLKKIAGCLKSLPPADFNDADFFNALSELCALISPLIKHDYFTHEHEYRLIHTGTMSADKDYIKGSVSKGIYIDTEPLLFDFKADSPHSPDVVVLGPKVDSIAEQKIRHLFKRKHYPDDAIKRSETPFR